MNKLKALAWAGLIFSLLGYLPKIGHFFSLIGFSCIFLMYRELAWQKLSSKAGKLYLIITLLSLMAVILAIFGWVYGQLIGGVLSIVAYAIGMYVAWSTYLLSLEMRKIAHLSGHKLFKVAARMLKISAFTMPLLIGFLLQAITQLFILIAVILYKPQQKIAA